MKFTEEEKSKQTPEDEEETSCNEQKGKYTKGAKALRPKRVQYLRRQKRRNSGGGGVQRGEGG